MAAMPDKGERARRALPTANVVRKARAECRARVKAGRSGKEGMMLLAELLADGIPECMENLTMYELLEWIPYAHVRDKKSILVESSTNAYTKLRALGERRQGLLVETLKARA